MSAATAAVASGWALKVSGKQQPDIEGVCEDEPAVDMLFRWQTGQLIHESMVDAGPQPDWKPYNRPGTQGMIFIPPDWEGTAAWADSYTRHGAPIWRDEPMAQPHLLLSHVVSPDGRSSFSTVTGLIDDALLDAEEVSLVARQGIVGDNPRLRPICMIDNPGAVDGPSWFTADRHRSNLMITMGTYLQMPDSTLPMTGLGYNAMYMRRRQSEEVMYDVFLRILFQFLRSAGGGSTPTPTPTPEV